MSLISNVKIITSSILPEGTCTLSVDLKDQTHKTNANVNIKFGVFSLNVKLLGYHGQEAGTSICFAPDVLKTLMLPASICLNLNILDASNTWHIGPLIGVFGNRVIGGKSIFGEQTGFFRKLNTIAKSMNAMMVCFSPADIDWDKQIITGYMPIHDTNEWVKWPTPFPDTIYDRGLFPKGNKRLKASQARKILRQHPGLKMFNPSFFGKWKTHRLLSNHEELVHYLPETRLYSNWADIESMVSKHKTLYLKPTGGSSGRGIMTLSKQDSIYVLQYRHMKQTDSISIDSQVKASHTIHKFINNRRYIVQQGLDLAHLDSRPFDIRVMMQRNIYGDWLLTGMAARVAGVGSYLSNIHAGGHAEKLSSVLSKTFAKPVLEKQIFNTIRRVCKITAAWLSSEVNPLFGEFAMDLGIDTKGQVWIIELNAIPGRSVFRRIKAFNIAKRALERPLEFAIHLAGFSSTGGAKG